LSNAKKVKPVHNFKVVFIPDTCNQVPTTILACRDFGVVYDDHTSADYPPPPVTREEEKKDITKLFPSEDQQFAGQKIAVNKSTSRVDFSIEKVRGKAAFRKIYRLREKKS
jgi:hypothetical protein